jgi:hypothetical protein
MATLHSLMALYGALDDAVTAQDEPDSAIAATVERFLPGTTGPGRQGWFNDIRKLVRRLSLDPVQTEFPNRDEALDDLGGATVTDTGVGERALSPAEAVRFLYVMGAHASPVLWR